MISYWTGVAAAFSAGAVIGGVVVRIKYEKDMRAEIDERITMIENTYNKALALRDQPVESPSSSPNVFTLDYEDLNEEEREFITVSDTGDGIGVSGVANNNYQKAISAVETPIELFVDGGKNDYGMEYIEEEDYLEEDGRFKGKIDILMDGTNPVFLMDGDEIDDWDQRVGDSILVDFYKLVPPGLEPILYVRNHRTDEDYEVVRVSP